MAFEMKDRIGRLKHSQQQSHHEKGYIPDQEDIEEFLGGFFSTVNVLNKSVTQIGLYVDKIKYNHNVMLTSVLQSNEVKDETNDLMTQIKKISHEVHRRLKYLNGEIEQEEQGPRRNTADFRIKKSQYSTLSWKFHQVMSKYSEVQEEYREHCKNIIQRQLKYTGKKVTEDEVENMIESDNPAIFTQDILIDNAQKRQALGKIEAHHQAILLLEENIRELHVIFYDMALLVDDQGEMIDQIEHNVEIAVDTGRKEIVQFQRKNREYPESKIEQNNDDLQQELQREKEEKRFAIEQKHKLESKIVRLESDVDLLKERLRQSLEEPNFDFHLIARSHVIKKKEISRGAFGSVCKGTYRGCWVAVKEPHELILEGATIDDFRREVGCMAKVHHPNIVTFIGAVFDDQPMPMIILELMDMNLRSRYKKADVSRNLTLKIFQDVAYALHYLHEFREPIIHRDLSAPNVLLKSLPRGDYTAKVGDLGSANLAKFASTAGRGAIIYSAPEMFPSADPDSPHKKHTVKVDTFSYGILLCEVIIRKLPDPDRRREMLSEAGGKWKDMHKLIMNCIKAEPTERPAMSQILTTLREIERKL